jgi:hypothetical protein
MPAAGGPRPPQIFLDYTLQQLLPVLIHSAGKYPQYVQEMANLPILQYLSALTFIEDLFRRQLGRVFGIDTPAHLDEALLTQATALFADRCNDASEHAKPFMECLAWICTQSQTARIFPVVVGLDMQTTVFAMVVEAVSQPPPLCRMACAAPDPHQPRCRCIASSSRAPITACSTMLEPSPARFGSRPASLAQVSAPVPPASRKFRLPSRQPRASFGSRPASLAQVSC